MQWNAPISGYPVAESIAADKEKGLCKTHYFRSTLTLSESCRQSVQEGFAENYAKGLGFSHKLKSN